MERNACRNCGDTKKDGRCPNCIVGGILLEIKKPISEDWNTLGSHLRGLRSLSHRLLNAGMLGNVADLHTYDAKKRNGELAKGEKLKIYSYPHIIAERAAYVTWAEAAAKKVRKGKKVEEADRLLARAEMAKDLPSAMLAYANRITDGKFRLWMKLRAEERLPMYKKGSPIFLPPAACELIEVDKSSVRLSMKLHRLGRTELIALPTSGTAWRGIRLIAEGKAKLGDVKIIYAPPLNRDRKKATKAGIPHKGKWLLRITVTQPRPAAPEMTKGVAVAVNRGRYNFLYAVDNCGGRAVPLMPGADILEAKKRFKARRLSLKKVRHHRNNGSRGHGKGRFFEAETRLEDKESNFIHTACQQAAAALDKRCTSVGAGTVVIEDFNTIDTEDLRYMPAWPWLQLKQAVAWMCEKTSRTMLVVESPYISSICPQCQNEDTKQVNVRTGIFHCDSCGYARESDFVACYNMLDRSGVDMTDWYKTFERARRLAERTQDATE